MWCEVADCPCIFNFQFPIFNFQFAPFFSKDEMIKNENLKELKIENEMDLQPSLKKHRQTLAELHLQFAHHIDG